MKFRSPKIMQLALAGSLGLAAVSAPALAHHSFAMFDRNTITELKDVTVLEVRWGNPHVFFIVQSGKQRYALEGSSPSALRSMGWKFNSIKAGDKLDVTFFPLRNGKPGGALSVATFEDGSQLRDS
ncbi:DUF6152 family protein [Aurantiacibacter rhizosphaerae]|uniref:Uncharacterized protein n=1 Tax=Aurantiacibacter rhizosphaerae TaxID=2691582 RepID=A0A844X9V9_9SPHN|nr:DUF6152 family protein [Aurantiacibacter rhizosphaerae]MWV27137.1 hypothetical protein [Aurantiacibacter rhizosphaerae]